MLRRPRPVKRFAPRLEVLEHRNMLSGDHLGHFNFKIEIDEAVGSVNGQLQVLAVAHPDLASGNASVDIYKYNQPTTGNTVGTFSYSQTISTDVPAGPNVKVAFGDLNRDGLPDLAVAGPDGQGAFVADVFTNQGGTTGYDAASGKVIGMTSGGGVKGGGLVLADLDHDGMSDVVISTDTQVGFLFFNSSGYTSTVVANPFVPYLPGGSAAIQDSKNIADGAAKGQAQEGVVSDRQGGYDLVMEADNQFLFTPININPPAPGATGPTVSFGFENSTGTVTNVVDSITINPGGTSTAQPLTSPLMGGAPSADASFAIGEIDNASPGSGLVALIGNKLYVGTAGPTATGTTGFTWSVEKLGPDHIQKKHIANIFLANLNSLSSPADFYLFTVAVQPQSGSPAAAIDIYLGIDEDESGPEEGDSHGSVIDV